MAFMTAAASFDSMAFFEPRQIRRGLLFFPLSISLVSRFYSISSSIRFAEGGEGIFTSSSLTLHKSKSSAAETNCNTSSLV